MAYDPYESVGEAVHPSGLRKGLAMVLFFLLTTLPTVFLWQNPPRPPEPAHGPIGIGGHPGFHGPAGHRFGPRPMGSHYGGQFQSQPARGTSLWNLLAPVMQLF